MTERVATRADRLSKGAGRVVAGKPVSSEHPQFRDSGQPTGHDLLAVRDPETGEAIAQLQISVADEVDLMVGRASEAARAPAPLHRRITALQAAAQAVEDGGDSFVDTLVAEGVKTIREARVEVSRAADTLRMYAEEAGRFLDPRFLPARSAKGHGRAADLRRIPGGVAVAITPFNDPLNLVAHKVGAAVAAGCPVIVKPHELTPLSGHRLVGLEAWTGLGTAAVQVVTGRGDVGKQLVTDPRVRIVSFTGGARTGRRIAEMAGVKKLIMELGSNCPVLVWEDADPSAVTPQLVAGMVSAAGQNCVHPQRIFVHEDVYDAVQSRLVAQLSSVRLGPKREDATQMGPLITAAAAERVHAMVRSAAAAGASVLTGGHRVGDVWYEPTLLTDVPPDHALMHEEIFGPVATLCRVSNIDEAVQLMNLGSGGLQAGVFTDSAAVIDRATSQLRYGTVLINDTSDFRIDSMPFGGLGMSGLGREGGAWGIAEYTELQLVLSRVAPRPS